MIPELALIRSTSQEIALELVVLMRRVEFLKSCAAGFPEGDPGIWSDVMRREQVIRQLALLELSSRDH